MWRKYAGYTLLSTYAFCFFTVVFHTVAHAQTPQQEIKEQPKVLGAHTKITISPPDPTPTVYASNLVEPKTIPSITPTTTATPTPTATPQPTITIAPTETPQTPPPTAPQSTPIQSG